MPKMAKALRILAFSAKVLPIVSANEIAFGQTNNTQRKKKRD